MSDQQDDFDVNVLSPEDIAQIAGDFLDEHDVTWVPVVDDDEASDD
jgi:CBS domain-containing protein